MDLFLEIIHRGGLNASSYLANALSPCAATNKIIWRGETIQDPARRLWTLTSVKVQ